jgi:hypothetical protein
MSSGCRSTCGWCRRLRAVAEVNSYNRLIRIASRLGQVPVGSSEADRVIHEALDRLGPAPPYTTTKSAAAELLPPGFEWRQPDYSGGAVYASCRRSGMEGPWPHPHHGQWSASEPLAMCGAALRAWAKLAKG